MSKSLVALLRSGNKEIHQVFPIYALSGKQSCSLVTSPSSVVNHSQISLDVTAAMLVHKTREFKFDSFVMAAKFRLVLIPKV